MRICLVYDSLYPYMVGGAELWYWDLAQELAARGHDVTYLTRRQWARSARPELRGVRVIGLEPPLGLYDRQGRRRILQTLVFGLGVFVHLLRHGRRYDAVHGSSFPYFSLLAAAALRPLKRFELVVDWFEVWTLAYWREYLGPGRGRIGWLVQRLCLLPRQHVFCFSELHAARLREYGVHGDVVRLTGLYAGEGSHEPITPSEPTIFFAGRQLPEKRVLALVPALALARKQVPGLRADIFGDGPDHPRLLRSVEESGLSDVVTAPGIVERERLVTALRQALCLVLPSRREGYGRVVVEAAASGVPSIVVRGSENAAVELIEEGVNGFVASSDSPGDLAAAIVRVYEAGAALRDSTHEWFGANADRLSLAGSVEKVAALYADAESLPAH